MKRLIIAVLSSAFLFTAEADARKVKILTTPHEASIYIDNQFVGNGTMEIEVKQQPVVIRVQQDGYITYESKIMPYDKRKSIPVTLMEDKFYVGSLSSGLVNKYLTIVIDPLYFNIEESGNLNLNKAWRMLHNVLLNYFDEFSASDYHGGYLQTPWHHKDFGAKVSRTRVTIRDISSPDQPAFQIKVSCEVANKIQAAKGHFDETNRIPKELQPMVEELQTRIGKVAKQ